MKRSYSLIEATAFGFGTAAVAIVSGQALLASIAGGAIYFAYMLARLLAYKTASRTGQILFMQINDDRRYTVLSGTRFRFLVVHYLLWRGEVVKATPRVKAGRS